MVALPPSSDPSVKTACEKPSTPLVTNVIVLSVLVEARLALPTVSVATPAGTLATTVPSDVMPVTVTVYVSSDPVTLADRVPPAVLPARLTSDAVNPVTGSLNFTSNLTDGTLVGSACPAAWLMVTAGPVMSNVTVLSVLVHAVLGTPLPLTAAPAGTRATTVPELAMPVTETV